jgi:hypothetical protein
VTERGIELTHHGTKQKLVIARYIATKMIEYARYLSKAKDSINKLSAQRGGRQGFAKSIKRE